MRHFLVSSVIALAISALNLPAFAAMGAVNDVRKNMGMSPHKALYDIKLAGVKSGAQILNISGQMVFEWQPSCDGWLSTHRFNLLYEYADSEPMMIASDFNVFESFDGKTLDFTSQRKRNGQLFEEFMGNATLDETGQGKAVYSRPDGLEFQLKPNSLFPTMHTIRMLNAIKNKEKFFHSSVFDGADEEGPVEINAFIGKSVTPTFSETTAKNINADLVKPSAHTIRLAFFPLSQNAPSPDYEMNIDLHDNGVISSMFIDYGNFSITQKLRALEPLKSACPSESLQQ